MALKVAVVAPAANVTDAGTVSEGLLLPSVTLKPPAERGDLTTALHRCVGMGRCRADNTAVGSDACLANTIGGANTGVGSFALIANTNGTANTAVGASNSGW